MLCLPAELKNQIYYYTAVELTSITLTAQIREPAILQVCRQVRSESLEMYYHENAFRVPIVDCDASLSGACFRHLRRMDKRLEGINVRFPVSVCPSCESLMAWYEEVHSRRSCALGSLDRSRRPKIEIMVAATRTARQWSGVPWEVSSGH